MVGSPAGADEGPRTEGNAGAAAAGDPRPRRAATREAIAHAFLAEYHRLLADALPDFAPGGLAPSVRQRAFAWRVTATRIPLVPDRCWPTWLLEHLLAAGATPVVGPEYRRQRDLLIDLLADRAPIGRPIA